MALFDAGAPVANVALSDTFNTWRIRTNQINTQAAGLASNNTFTGTENTFTGTASFEGPVTAPVVTANTLAGTVSTAAQPNITSVGTLTSLATTGLFTAPTVQANTLTGTVSTAAQPNITSVGTLASLTVSGSMTAANAGFSGAVTAPTVVANSFVGDGSQLTGLTAGGTAFSAF